IASGIDIRNFDSNIYPPNITVGITADSICFFIDLHQGDFGRYCSVPGEIYIAQNDSERYIRQFSVRQDFDTEFRNIEEIIIGKANELNIVTNTIAREMIISEMEDPGRIVKCASEEDCNADIVGAPFITFWDDYDEAVQQTEDVFQVAAGFVWVVNEINIEENMTLLPGDYIVSFWFEPNGNGDAAFVKATVDGITSDGEEVNNQQIPAVPSAYIRADGQKEIVNQISAWKLARWCCFWQSNCP
ncbi:MAG: hypothetical protein PVG14_16640, partial [Anaerolineales bacterium]